MNRILIIMVLVLVVVALIPPTLIVYMRNSKKSLPRIHLVQDMDNQPKFRAQHANALFADGRAMRQPVANTVARGELQADTHYNQGVINDAWVTMFPIEAPKTPAMLLRGEERFNIYCAPCHGTTGYGNGPVDKHVRNLIDDPIATQGTTWVRPKSIHDQDIVDQPVGQLFNTITHGVRTMGSYASRVSVADRWAIIAHIRALQANPATPPADATKSVPANMPQNKDAPSQNVDPSPEQPEANP